MRRSCSSKNCPSTSRRGTLGTLRAEYPSDPSGRCFQFDSSTSLAILRLLDPSTLLVGNDWGICGPDVSSTAPLGVATNLVEL
eukprot:Skav210550  [mRNA]  locus=scaffold4856:50150:50640:+ [translate_table: standard]